MNDWFSYSRVRHESVKNCGSMETSNNLKITIVEDQKGLAVAYSKAIEKLGYPSPSVFNDGTSIVKALTKDRQSFNVIIMDYQMPEMNGIEAAKIIQRYNRDTR